MTWEGDAFEAKKVTAWDIRKKAKRTLEWRIRRGLLAGYRFYRREDTETDQSLLDAWSAAYMVLVRDQRVRIYTEVGIGGTRRMASSYRKSGI